MMKKLYIIMLAVIFSFSMAAFAWAQELHWELEPTGQYGPVTVGDTVTLKVHLVNGTTATINVEGYSISFEYDPAELTWTGDYTNTPRGDIIADNFQLPEDDPPYIKGFNAFKSPAGSGYDLAAGESFQVGAFDFEVVAAMEWDTNVDITLYYRFSLDGVNFDGVSEEIPCEVQGPDVGVAQTFPDLVIIEKSEEWINPADITQGYKVNYIVKNQGGAAAGASIAKLTIDGIEKATAVCGALDPGVSESGTFAGPFTCGEAGDPNFDMVEVCADSEDAVDENDETNNCRENEWTCAALTFDIGNGVGEPGDTDRTVGVSLKNDVAVAGIQVDICEVNDYLSLLSIELTDRLKDQDGNPLFTSDFRDDYPQAGCARLLLYSQGGSVIAAGDGPIFILHYGVDAGATAHSCVEITSDNLLITDENDEPLTAAEDSGSFFFGIYGDPWPYDDVNGTVGDGEVNIFDVVRDVQIILGTYTPIDCEFVAGDVPTGFGTNCEAPDGEINVSDVLEMVRKILGRDNCIDLY